MRGAAPLSDWNPEPGRARTTADPLEDAHRQTPLPPTWAAVAPWASIGYCRIRFQCSSGAATLRQLVLQQLIEVEAAEVIGGGRYERTENRVTERNG